MLSPSCFSPQHIGKRLSAESLKNFIFNLYLRTLDSLDVSALSNDRASNASK
jgi:hypothetical protein